MGQMKSYEVVYVEKLKAERDDAYAAYRVEHLGRAVDAKAYGAELQQLSDENAGLHAQMEPLEDRVRRGDAKAAEVKAEVERLRADAVHWHQCFDRSLDRETEKDAEVERLQTWEQIAMRLWNTASADPDDDLSRRALVGFLAAADDQLEAEQEQKHAAEEGKP